MSDSEPMDAERLQRRSAQAMVATFLQMARHAELAHSLQKARAGALERRIESSADAQEIARLKRQLEAQRDQGESIRGAVDRFRRRAGELASFSEVGLTQEDLEAFWLTSQSRTADAAPAAAEALDDLPNDG
jgi:muconolactone delta-isomerase